MTSAMFTADVTYTQYWETLFRQPVTVWQPILDAIRTRHALPTGAWHRFALGRNAVFRLDEAYVVKVIPPFWQRDAQREAAALSWVHERLPVTTPTLLAAGEWNGWHYLVEPYLSGQVLRDVWPQLTEAQRVDLATQHGTIMAALHNLPIKQAPGALDFDWQAMISEQLAVCATEMGKANVPALLLADLDAYLAAQQAAVLEHTPTVLLHGDLNFLNLLVDMQQGHWQITALIDWSDAKVGPIAHEWISPGVHMYRGDRAPLHALYAAYAQDHALARTAAFEAQIMARAMIYYADTFRYQLSVVPGALDCTCWTEVAQRFWHLNQAETTLP